MLPKDHHRPNARNPFQIQGEVQLHSGRGAQIRPQNPFIRRERVAAMEMDWDEISPLKTQILLESAKTILNKVESPDIPGSYSLNPYQGCEHGCVYCYARPTHTYWGFDSGLDFESKIIAKTNAVELLEATMQKPGWKPGVVLLSGNTDCYQPIERRLQITSGILKTLWAYRVPVMLITKNALILRDLQVLQEMAKMGLVQVAISLTSGSDNLRRALEPRSSSLPSRLATISRLSEAGIPVKAMVAPVIPSLNSEELPEILQLASEAGALGAGYTMLRLPGQVSEVFAHWLRLHFPDRAEKVLSLTKSTQGETMSSSAFGERMRGKGPYADSVARLFQMAHRRFFPISGLPPLVTHLFQIPQKGGQLSLF